MPKGRNAMKPIPKPAASIARSLVALFCIAIIAPGEMFANMSFNQQSPSPDSSTSKIPADQLDSLVAPIALYPDPLLAQTLAASTYPLEVIQLQQWLAKNPDLKDKALADEVAKQPWDPSVQALAGLPEVVKRLANDIQWTADLGNAFLAQQSEVMDAVQRMRDKAVDKGTLKSTAEQRVETKTIESKQVIVVEQADPQVIYVPSYDPVVVWGPPLYYPYPPIYYPPWGYYAAGVAISFGVGVMMGAFWGGGWGWGCGWGHNDIDINVNNHFNRNSNFNRGGNRVTPQGYRGGATGDRWQHNPQHRGGTPYSDRATANRFGGTARGDSLSNRQAGARQQISRQGGNLSSSRAGSAGISNRSSGAGVSNRASGSGVSNRSSGAGVSNRASGTGTSNRASGTGVSNRSSSGLSNYNRSGGSRRSESIGSRDLSRSSSGSRSALGGGSRGYSGSSARASSSRGFSSMGSRGGGGASRGGGGGRR
jgi:hypothetical protein